MQTPTTVVRAIDPYPRPAGVPDEVYPPGTRAYELLERGHCKELLAKITNGEASWVGGKIQPALIHLYSAAGHACLSHWADAESHFRLIDTAGLCVEPEDVPGTNSSFEGDLVKCQEVRMAVYHWTARLLKAHQADPAFVPNFPPRR